MGRYCTVKYCKKKDNKLHQIYLTSFTNGRIENSNTISFKAYQNNDSSLSNNNVNKRKILVATTNRLQYRSTNFEQNFPGSIQCNTYVGLFKREHNKMKIYPADIFHCSPILDVKKVDDNVDEINYKSKVDALTESFGSKNKQRAMKSRIRYQVSDVDNQDSIIKTLEESFIQLKDNETVNNSVQSNTEIEIIPPRNDNADTASEVYNLFDIMSQEEYDEIEPQASVLQNATDENVSKWEQEQIYSKFVLHILKNSVGKLTLHKSKLLAYYDYIVKFSKLRFADLRKKDIAPGIPDPFKEMLIKNFVIITGNSHKTMPPKIRDKLLAYAFILALFIEDFTIELSLFLQDYNISLQKLTKLIQLLGCNVLTRKINDVATKVAVLKLPLFKPQTKFFTRGKRKNESQT